MIVRQIHLMIGGDLRLREIEHRLVKTGKKIGILIEDIPAAIPQSEIGAGGGRKAHTEGTQEAVFVILECQAGGGCGI